MLTAEQLAKRKLGIGGSDAAAVAGVCPFKTSLDVYMDKLSLTVATEEENEYMHFGTMLEPLILKEYERRAGETCLPRDENTEQYFKDAHEIYTWMRANIDGYLFNKNIVIECKTASARTAYLWGEPGTDNIPTNYLIQCAHYAIVYDATRVDLAVLIGGNDFRIYHYHRNQALEEKLIEKERTFWYDHVLKEIPPDPVNLHDSMLLWPDSLANSKIATNDTYMHLCEYYDLKLKIKEMENKADMLKLKVQQEMKENDTLINANGQKLATWKTQSAERLDMQTFKKNYPQIYLDNLVKNNSRVFRLGNLEN